MSFASLYMNREAQKYAELSDELQEMRLLTEVDNLLANQLPDGSFDPTAEQDVATNLFTATQEMAMPYAVTTTIQRAEERLDEEGRKKRQLMWLGKCAITVAESYKDFHFSEAAHARGRVEVAEANHAQDNVTAGVAQMFVSPKMSRFDAPAEVAKQEHLHDDDAVRVGYTLTDKDGNVVGRRLESLLVRDIPLESWVAMLRDPNNIFGTAFDVRDERSALSVMELFKDMDLPEEKVPEGPVTLVDAVLPYVADEAAQASVTEQLKRFRSDQALYKEKAEEKATEWLEFEKALASSLNQQVATYDIKRFISMLQHEWNEDDLHTIYCHEQPDGEYAMTRRLAAVLERAKRNLLAGIAAIQTGNDKVLNQMDGATARKLREQADFIDILRTNNTPPQEIAEMYANLNRSVARQNLKTGGGCMGESNADFGNSKISPDGSLSAEEGKGEESKVWTWKKGVCRVTNCPSPKPTEVGPCSVCRGCQHKFDAGQDPTKVKTSRVETVASTEHIDLLLSGLSSLFEKEKERQSKKSKKRAGALALAASDL